MAAYKDEAGGGGHGMSPSTTTIGQVKTKESSNVAFGQERRHWSMSRSFCCSRQQIWI